MSKVAVVYWSGTGNTEQMAEKVAVGAKDAGAEVSVFTATEFSADQMDHFDAIAFGCPSMGAEQLEESEFEPMFRECESKVGGQENRPIRLLWLGRRRMDAQLGRTVPGDRAVLTADPVICNEAPDDEANENCRSLGKALA